MKVGVIQQANSAGRDENISRLQQKLDSWPVKGGQN